jgi:hypothetical protein
MQPSLSSGLRRWGGNLEASFETRRSSLSEPVHNLQRSAIEFIKDELNLIRLELIHQLKGMKRDAVLTALCATLAVLSILPLMAAAVIWVGWELGGHFGLGSLIVGAVCLVLGGAGAAIFANRLMKKDFSFPRSRAVLHGGGFNANTELH